MMNKSKEFHGLLKSSKNFYLNHVADETECSVKRNAISMNLDTHGICSRKPVKMKCG